MRPTFGCAQSAQRPTVQQDPLARACHLAPSRAAHLSVRLHFCFAYVASLVFVNGAPDYLMSGCLRSGGRRHRVLSLRWSGVHHAHAVNGHFWWSPLGGRGGRSHACSCCRWVWSLLHLAPCCHDAGRSEHCGYLRRHMEVIMLIAKSSCRQRHQSMKKELN